MDRAFQVNLRGIIDLLSNHIYSSPDVFVRELLQNGIDALVARSTLEPSASSGWGLRVLLRRGDGPPELHFEDDGVGLDEADVHRFLATLGESSKRRSDGSELPVEGDFIGQFGIGLLACFLVTDEIVVLTRSAKSETSPTIEWRGRHDGTYSVVVRTDQEHRPGTTVFLRARTDREEWFDAARVEHLLTHYGRLLTWPVTLHAGEQTLRINDARPPWRVAREDMADLTRQVLDYGKGALGEEFLDWIPLRSESGGADGVAFILPFEPSLGSAREHRVYLKGMLVTDRSREILPTWAFFVHAIVDAKRLRPTASRESLYEDDALDATREELGTCIRAWLVHMGKTNPERVSMLLRVHHRAIKALAAGDDDVLELFADFLPFETTLGEQSFAQLRAARKPLVFASSVDAFRQMAPVAVAQGLTLINVGYAYDRECLERGCSLHQLACTELDATELTSELDDVAPDDYERASPFLAAAAEALKASGCDVSLKAFRPEELPTFYACTRDVEFRRMLERSQTKSTGVWSDVLGALAKSRPNQSERPLLCFNYRNPLVRRLVAMDETPATESAIRLLYVHALLLGHRPLSPADQQLLPRSILDLIEWGLEAQRGTTLQ